MNPGGTVYHNHALKAAGDPSLYPQMMPHCRSRTAGL
jgi:hypothetical protein